MSIDLLKKEVFIKMVYFILFLLLANITGIVFKFYVGHDYIYGLVPLFDFDAEKNIPTLYSSFAIIIASMFLAVIALAQKKQRESWVPWIGLSVIFLFLSIDEVASIHERLVEPVRETLNTSGLLYFAWVIPYGGAVGIFFICYLKFLIDLPRKIMILFVASGLIFVSGAIGFELLGGMHVELYGRENIIYSIYYTCEEFLEMIGIATFIYALLSYITHKSTSFTLTIGK